MKVVFRVESEIGAGFVEIALDSLPFMPAKGMWIAPHPEADLLEVEGVYWSAGEPSTLEVWLVEAGDRVSPWSYFKKQGYRKGACSKAAGGAP